jgi:hypothetical protein
MNLSEAVRLSTTVRVWSASGDSRCGIATEFPTIDGGARRFAVQLINRPRIKIEVMPETRLNTEWLEEPRIDVKWMNTGSVWVRNTDHKLWNRPVPSVSRCLVQSVDNGVVRFQEGLSDPSSKRLSHTSCYAFMNLYTRLWGLEVPPDKVPNEPLPYVSKKQPGRPKRVEPGPKSALDRLLSDDLIPDESWTP